MGIEQFSVKTNLPRFKPGTILSVPYLTDAMNVPHGADKATQAIAIEVTDANEGELYAINVEGEIVSYIAESGDTEEDIAVALAEEANGNPLVRGLFTAEASEATGDWFVDFTANKTRGQYEVSIVEGSLDLTQTTEGSEGSRFPVAKALYINVDGLASSEPSTPGTAALWVSELRGVTAFRYVEEQEYRSRADQTTAQRFDTYYVRRGVVGYDTAPNANRGDAVYIETAGDDAGKFFPDDSGTREEVPGMEWDGPNRLAIKLF